MVVTGADFIMDFHVTIFLVVNMKEKDNKPKDKSMDIKLSKVYKSTELNEIKLKTYIATVKPSKS